MNIETQRTLIRPFISTDMKDIFNIYRSVDTCKYLLHEPWTEDNVEEEFAIKLKEKNLDEHSKLSLACVAEGGVIGDISIWYTGMKDTVEIGYVFNPQYSGKGYAFESVQSVVNYLFENLKVHRIQANMDARNIASSKLCEKLGMRKEAHFIKDFWNKGEWTDSFVYGMLIEDLKND